MRGEPRTRLLRPGLPPAGRAAACSRFYSRFLLPILAEGLRSANSPRHEINNNRWSGGNGDEHIVQLTLARLPWRQGRARPSALLSPLPRAHVST